MQGREARLDGAAVLKKGLGFVLFPSLALLVAAPLGAAFLPLFRSPGAFANLGAALGDTRFLSSFGFGLGQAFASSILALLIGLPGAFLLARRRFPGKRFLSALSAVPFCVPPLIVAIGFVLYYGRQGYVNRVLMALFGLEAPPLDFLYSFKGIVLAHAFYNFPLIMRLVGDAWASASKAQEEAAELLGASRLRVFFTISLPSIVPAIGSALSLVFLLCFYSFVLVLLFGGPGVGTPEVELYRAARFDFNKGLAAAFALVESAVAFAVLALYARLERRIAGRRADAALRYTPSAFKTGAEKAAALAYGLFIAVFFLGPLACVALESLVVKSAKYGTGRFGLANYTSLFSSASFGRAALNTVLLGLASAALAAALGFVFSIALKKKSSSFLSSVLPMAPLAVSSVVLAYGWSELLGGSSVLAIAAVQAVSAYPFILRSIQGAVGLSDERYAQSALTLGSSRLGAALKIRLPLALPSLLSGFAFAFAISAGDANALIVAPVRGFDTLALLLYRLAGSYRFNEACAAAVILGLTTALVFFLKDARDAVA
jgi:thiamine transport system permease protein